MALSISTFQQVANIKPQGELQVKDQQLENRGTIGNTIARFFHSIGAFFGLCQKAPTQQERQQTALTAFREALTTQFGSDISQRVTQNLAGPLTGAKVNQAITDAKRELMQIRYGNEQALSRMLPGEYIVTPMTKDVGLRGISHFESQMGKGLYDRLQTRETALQNFTGLCQDARVKNVEGFKALFNPSDNWSPNNGHTLYREMLTGTANSQAHSNTRTLSDEQVRQLAVSTLTSMRHLETPEEVEQAHQSFNQYTSSIKTMLSDIANGRVQSLQQGREQMDRAYENIQTAFKLEGGLMSDDGLPIFDAAFGKALAELPPHERTALFERMSKEPNPLSRLSGRHPEFALLEANLTARMPQPTLND